MLSAATLRTPATRGVLSISGPRLLTAAAAGKIYNRNKIHTGPEAKPFTQKTSLAGSLTSPASNDHVIHAGIKTSAAASHQS